MRILRESLPPLLLEGFVTTCNNSGNLTNFSKLKGGRGGLGACGESEKVGRVIGIDLGEKRVGVSISDEMLVFAHPLCVIPFKSTSFVLEELSSLAERYGVGSFVVGIPKNMDGSLGEPARRAIRFSRKLQSRSGLPVILWDERLTTSQAEKEMIGFGLSRKRRRMSIDEAASVLILESYLWNRRNNPDQSERS